VRIDTLPKLDGGPAFVIGTGPSLRCFPLEFLARTGGFCLGLNQAWKYVKTHYSITVHPELVQEYEAAGVSNTKWIIKKKPPMADLELDDPKHHVFLTSDDLSTVTRQPADTLYLGEGVQTTAIDLLTRMGAKYIILVGVDMNSVDGDFHGHDQHVRWLGQTPEHQYALYRRYTAKVRFRVREKFGVQVMALTPFLGTNAAHEDYVRLKTELRLPPLPKPKDTSPYVRTKKKT